MKLCTHAMSGIFPDDAIAAFLAIALHRAADITDPAARDRRANTLVKALTRRVDQPLRFGADWPAAKVAALSPLKPFRAAPRSMLTISPSRMTRSLLGMP